MADEKGAGFPKKQTALQKDCVMDAQVSGLCIFIFLLGIEVDYLVPLCLHVCLSARPRAPNQQIGTKFQNTVFSE